MCGGIRDSRFGIPSDGLSGLSFDVDVSRFFFVHAHYDLIGHCFIQGTDDPDRDWRGLMIHHCPSKQLSYELLMDGVSVKFSYAPNDLKANTHTFHTLFE